MLNSGAEGFIPVDVPQSWQAAQEPQLQSLERDLGEDIQAEAQAAADKDCVCTVCKRPLISGQRRFRPRSLQHYECGQKVDLARKRCNVTEEAKFLTIIIRMIIVIFLFVFSLTEFIYKLRKITYLLPFRGRHTAPR